MLKQVTSHPSTQLRAVEPRVKGLYAIVDSKFNPYPTLPELAEKYLEGGCRVVQLRIKTRDSSLETRAKSIDDQILAARGSCLESAGQIALLKKKFDFTFIVNDHADIAHEVGADGVHVGENDASVSEIKKCHGPKLIVGYSSHSIEEAKKAVADGADYVAFGAIFPTKTKGPGHPVQGVEKLKALRKEIKVPLVAIGGIGRHNIDEVIAAGADAVAMITALAEADDIISETKHFIMSFPRK